mgnify:CR=1 FL=1
MKLNKLRIKIKVIKNAKGVTMLALVVTIIVLLILAAITLNLAVGENGIIARAKLARDKAKNASIGEEEAMNAASGEIDNAGNGGSGGGTCPECPDTKPLEDRIKELESQVGALQQQLETEKANKAELENRITELNNQIAELNKQIEAGNTQKAELQEEITRLQNQLAASQAENERLRAQIAELNTQKAELETEITRLQNQLAAVQTENEKLQGQITNLNNQIGNLNTQIGEKNKTIETQKQTIANLQGQITEKDRLISQKNETIKTMQGTIDGLNTQIANLNNQINQLKAKQATGNVAVGDVLAGKTFSNSREVGLTGTMANNGALNGTVIAGQSYNIPAGYHNGSGKITGASLASQTPGNASAEDIKAGKIAWVNGQAITGIGGTAGGAENYYIFKGGLLNAKVTGVAENKNNYTGSGISYGGGGIGLYINHGWWYSYATVSYAFESVFESNGFSNLKLTISNNSEAAISTINLLNEEGATIESKEVKYQNATNSVIFSNIPSKFRLTFKVESFNSGANENSGNRQAVCSIKNIELY